MKLGKRYAKVVSRLMSFSLVSRIVHRLISPINGEIIVKEQLGQYSLYIAGIPQSGGIVREIWKKGVSALPDFKPVPSVLLLGLGGGSVVHLVKKRWPNAKILSVELDPHVVVISRTYFGLDEVSGIKIVTGDAFKVVHDKKGGVEKGKFDLVLIDIYLGQELPGFVQQEEFINELKSLLTDRGVLVFNHLLDKKGRETISSFEEKLKKVFPKIKTLQTPSNELVFAYLR